MPTQTQERFNWIDVTTKLLRVVPQASDMMFLPRKFQLTSPLTPPVRGVVLISIGKIWIVRERGESFKAKESRTLENKEWCIVLKLYVAELLWGGIVMDPSEMALMSMSSGRTSSWATVSGAGEEEEGGDCQRGVERRLRV